LRLVSCSSYTRYNYGCNRVSLVNCCSLHFGFASASASVYSADRLCWLLSPNNAYFNGLVADLQSELSEDGTWAIRTSVLLNRPVSQGGAGGQQDGVVIEHFLYTNSGGLRGTDISRRELRKSEGRPSSVREVDKKTIVNTDSLIADGIFVAASLVGHVDRRRTRGTRPSSITNERQEHLTLYTPISCF